MNEISWQISLIVAKICNLGKVSGVLETIVLIVESLKHAGDLYHFFCDFRFIDAPACSFESPMCVFCWLQYLVDILLSVVNEITAFHAYGIGVF